MISALLGRAKMCLICVSHSSTAAHMALGPFEPSRLGSARISSFILKSDRIRGFLKGKESTTGQNEDSIAAFRAKCQFETSHLAKMNGNMPPNCRQKQESPVDFWTIHPMATNSPTTASNPPPSIPIPTVMYPSGHHRLSTPGFIADGIQSNQCEKIPLLLHLTGLYYLGGKSSVLKTAKIMLAIGLCAIVTYQTISMLIVAILDGHFTAQMAHTMINFNWMLQAQISMGFLLYWQARGHLPALFHMMAQFEGYSRLWMHKFASIAYASLFLLDVAVVILILVLFWAMGSKQREKPSEENHIIQVYGNTLLHDKFFIAVHYYTRFVWLVVLIVFISAASGIHHQIKEANQRLRKLSAHEPADPNAFADALNGQLMEHTELARWIRSVDRVFGVYTFLMVCLNIPVFIFSLSMLLLTLPNSPQWIHIVVPMVDILFSLCELIGLTIIPAKIHTRIHEVEKIIFDNVFIWKNLNTRIYQLANAFIMYANQPSLGITLWGFAVIRKPLILTTISLTATYLTVVIQFHSVGSEVCANVNSTKIE